MIQSEAVDPKINIHTSHVIKADELHKSKVPSIKHLDVLQGGIVQTFFEPTCSMKLLLSHDPL